MRYQVWTNRSSALWWSFLCLIRPNSYTHTHILCVENTYTTTNFAAIHRRVCRVSAEIGPRRVTTWDACWLKNLSFLFQIPNSNFSRRKEWTPCIYLCVCLRPWWYATICIWLFWSCPASVVGACHKTHQLPFVQLHARSWRAAIWKKLLQRYRVPSFLLLYM